MMTSEMLTIVMAADAAYAMPLATALLSIAESNVAAWPLDIHVLYEGIDDQAKTKVTGSLPLGSANVNWHLIDLPSFTSGYATLPHVSKMTYARLMLSHVVPAHTERALYLDSDILVLGDLRALWRMDLGGATIGAVIDPFDQASGRTRVDAPPGHHVERYFNAGVLIVDIRKWRSKQISERSLRYLEQHPDSPYSDQDALNHACDGCWRPLDRGWNFQCDPSHETSHMAEETPVSILHFVANVKPWRVGNLSPNAPFYDRFRSRTRFARTRVQRLHEACQRAGYRLRRRSSLVEALWQRLRLVSDIQVAANIRSAAKAMRLSRR